MQQDAGEGLGVSPNFLISPHDWGTKGVERQREFRLGSPASCKSVNRVLYIRRAGAVQGDRHG